MKKNKTQSDNSENDLLCTGPHIYASDKFKYCWVRIPKCGSMSMHKVLWNRARYDFSEWSSSHTGWDDYFKFAFVRNPWSRLYSCYKSKVIQGQGGCSQYLHRFSRKKISFTDWVKIVSADENILKDRHFSPIHTLLINKDFDSMDFIGKVENYQKDWNTICDKIGIPRRKLPRKNKTKHKHYTEYYNSETRELVAERYARDIEYFGYKFGD